MAPRESPLFQFIKEALMDKKYPNLNWINRNEGTMYLYCPLKSKSGWKPVYEKIYDDYGKLKTRKSNDNRQRFLQAMKVCPFINLLKNKSSKEEKYYQFLEDGRSSVNASDEIDDILKSNEDVDMQTVQLSCASESEPATGGASVGDDGNDLANFSSTMLADSNYHTDEFPIDFNYDEDIQNDIHQLLNKLKVSGIISATEANCSTPLLADFNNSLQNVFGNDEELENAMMDLVVPDVTADDPESPENASSTSFFIDSNDLTRSSVSCNEAPDISNPFSLGEEELSYPLFPPDYDPEDDLIRSFGVPADNQAVDSLPAIPKADLDQLRSVQITSGESSKCRVAEVFRLNDNDDIVKRLQQNSASAGDNREKHYCMMVLKLGQT